MIVVIVAFDGFNPFYGHFKVIFIWSIYWQLTDLKDCSHQCLCILYTSATILSLSILTAISRWTWVSRCLLKQRMMEVVVTTGAINRAKLQSNHHHQQSNTQIFLQAGCPSCRPSDSVKALKGKISHSMDLLTLSSPGGLPTLSLTTNSSWLPWWWVAMPLISPLMPVPQHRQQYTD